jgi:hypothetical protein
VHQIISHREREREQIYSISSCHAYQKDDGEKLNYRYQIFILLYFAVFMSYSYYIAEIGRELLLMMLLHRHRRAKTL